MIDNEKDRAALLARARPQIERAARQDLSQLYTEPLLADAANLLADLYAAGRSHGIEPDRWDLEPESDPLASAVLQAYRLDYQYQDLNRPDSVDACRVLLLRLHDERSALGDRHDAFDAELDAIVLPRTATTPPFGSDGQARLAISIVLEGRDTHWALILDRVPSPVVGIAAGFGATDLPAVADLADQVNHGHHGNPFRL
ncbi:hypothetical protein BAY61_32455 (plasmid) [Prauserella marina]|uniref:Uncharacterized protein n=1 Tax=Prauserella marina TaxID=530584 RepID=A0A222W1B7_9PSEU|nr:hypothetical protein [Prauserella marina]ASR39994.1 hypothetical protein BAY61_32455 [Prauserella marina]PWV71336.1 hypothetical protein DES30_11252 [Prauserella marina]SDD96303.1 hypothetical protein SAMN05421630_11560 [Prauserella marina]